MRIGTILVVAWLVIGVLAAWQRGYLAGDDADCAKASTVAVTAVAGPLNYVGLNPKIQDCEAPRPSK